MLNRLRLKLFCIFFLAHFNTPMLQKPAEKDNRWFVATDLETGLAIAQSNPEIRVACLATEEKFYRNPLYSSRNEPLILCVNQATDEQFIEKAVKA